MLSLIKFKTFNLLMIIFEDFFVKKIIVVPVHTTVLIPLIQQCINKTIYKTQSHTRYGIQQVSWWQSRLLNIPHDKRPLCKLYKDLNTRCDIINRSQSSLYTLLKSPRGLICNLKENYSLPREEAEAPWYITLWMRSWLPSVFNVWIQNNKFRLDT